MRVKMNVQSVREQQEHVFLAQLQTDTGTTQSLEVVEELQTWP